MNWKELLNDNRLGVNAASAGGTVDGRSQFQKDFDRIVFSPAFRRLQDKTQVFPLPESDFVHTRLTHSLEVSVVGRSLGNLVGERKGVKVPCFDLGNSPVEFLNTIRNHPIKKIALTTSNLTRVMAHLKTAYICSSLNLTAVSEVLQGQKVNIVACLEEVWFPGVRCLKL